MGARGRGEPRVAGLEGFLGGRPAPELRAVAEPVQLVARGRAKAWVLAGPRLRGEPASGARGPESARSAGFMP